MFKRAKRFSAKSLLAFFVGAAVLLQSGGATVISVAYASETETSVSVTSSVQSSSSAVSSSNASIQTSVTTETAVDNSIVPTPASPSDVPEESQVNNPESTSGAEASPNGQNNNGQENTEALVSFLADLNTQTQTTSSSDTTSTVTTNTTTSNSGAESQTSTTVSSSVSASSQSSASASVSVSVSTSNTTTTYTDINVKQDLPIKASDCHTACENSGSGDAGGITIGNGEMVWHFVLTGSDTSKPGKLFATFSNNVSVSDVAPGKVVNGVQHFYVKTSNTATLLSAKVKNAVPKYGKHLVFSLSDCVFGEDEPQPKPATISATKIVCDEESDLPNWGMGASDITKDTAAQFLATHPNCRLAEGWQFEYTVGDKANPGDNRTTLSGAPWNESSLTNAQGVTTWNTVATSGRVWVREVLQDGYIPFTYNTSSGQNTNNVTAEIYCHTDGLNYDNYDYVSPTEGGKTYYCVAFNAKKKTPPQVCELDVVSDGSELVVGGSNAVATYDDHPNWTAMIPGATWVWKTFFVADPKVDDTTTFTKQVTLASAPTSATLTVAADNSYTVSFNGTEVGADATEFNYYETGKDVYDVTSKLVSGVNTLSFTVKNWGNQSSDKYTNPAGLLYKLHVTLSGDGCETPVNQKPVITVNLPNPTTVSLGGAFVDLGASALDPEDGNITANIVATGTVNTSVLGTYTITYTVSDSKGLAADPKTRTVNVVEFPQCRDGADNDGDGLVDFPADTGCENGDDNDENNKPVITVVLPNPTIVRVGTLFTDPGATAIDQEDGNITANIVATGTVDILQVGTYTITYNVSDSKGLPADPKTRTVKVISECSDGIDNDGDGKSDMLDSGCDNGDDNDENTPPVISVLGVNPMNVFQNSVFTDPGATAFDLEDGTITPSVSGSVNTLVLGTYTITYTAQDSKSVAADPKTRTVNVVPVVINPECSDGIDNDGDGLVDFPADTGCENGDDNDENNKPVITVLGDNPLTLSVGAIFTDPGATALDLEDGVLVPNATGTVDVNTVGNYVITYTAVDSKGLAADPKTRTVKVISECSDGIDNDGDGKIDFPADDGCDGPNDDSENARPVITVLGDAPMTIVVGSAFTDPGATAFDLEDGTITPALISAGTVNTSLVGTYTITYNVSDSKGLAAVEKSRTVNVVNGGGGCTSNCGGSTPPICSNGSDDDGDGLPDYPRDPGCSSSSDNDERDGGPVITLVGANPLAVTVGSTFTDPGATATDPEDGDITSRITVSGTVVPTAVGTYTLTYNVTDTAGHAATPVSRTVNVVAAGCTSNCGGGGGGGSVPLAITNEKISTTTASGEAVITWNTNLAATSRVVYGITSVTSLGSLPLYGYMTSNATDTANVYTHSMTISGLVEGVNYYFRPVSHEGSQVVVGIELALNPKAPETCFYLREYMRMGQTNNPEEVIKLQRFLKDFEGFSTLAVTGFFDTTTDTAVRTFQDRYASDVLIPWNLPSNTGYVYYTTQKKINEIYCKRAFPLNNTQSAEIEAFKRLLESLNTTPVGTVTLPVVGSVGTGAGIAGGGSAANAEGQVAGVTTEEGELTDVATDNEPTMIDRGRIALADLLATVPNVTEKFSSEDEEKTSATGTDVSSEMNETGVENVAAIGFLEKFDNCTWALWVLFLIVLVLLAMYVRLWMKHKDDDDTPVFPSVS